jgi:hypothetical protein
MQHLRAVREQRRTAFAEIKASRVELHQRSNQGRRGAPFRCGQPLHLGDQLIVGEISKRSVRWTHALL